MSFPTPRVLLPNPLQPQTLYRFSKPEARPYVVVGADPQHADFGPFTPGTQTAGLQEAVNFAASNGKSKIFLMNGVYTLNANLNLPASVVLEGESQQAQIVLNNYNIYTASSTSDTANTVFYNLTLASNSNTYSLGINSVFVNENSVFIKTKFIGVFVLVNSGSARFEDPHFVDLYGNMGGFVWAYQTTTPVYIQMNNVIVENFAPPGGSGSTLFNTSSASSFVADLNNIIYIVHYTTTGQFLYAGQSYGFIILNVVSNTQVIQLTMRNVRAIFLSGLSSSIPFGYLFFSYRSVAAKGSFVKLDETFIPLDSYNPNATMLFPPTYGPGTTSLTVVPSYRELLSPTLPANPPASGVTYQNTNFFDIELIIPVTFSPTSTAAASATLQIGPTSTSLSVVDEMTEPAGGTSGFVKALKARIPSGWYFQISVTNATIGTATVLAVV